MKKTKPSRDEVEEEILYYLMHNEGVTGNIAVRAANDLMQRVDRPKSRRTKK